MAALYHGPSPGRRVGVALGSALAISLASTAPLRALETTNKAPMRAVRVTAAEMLSLSDRLIHQGQTLQAEKVLSLLARDPDPDIRNEARYRQSVLLEASGSRSAAAVLMRRIIDEKPNAATVRLKLADMLVRLGHEAAAQRELRAAQAIGLPPALARMVDRTYSALRARKPFGASFDFMLAPDSNINRATRSDSLGTVLGDFDISQDSQAKSGIGMSVRGRGYRRFNLSEGVSVLAQLSASSDLYRRSDFNFISMEAGMGPEFTLAGTQMSVEAAAGQTWFGGAPFSRQIRLTAAGRKSLGPRTAANGRLSLTSVDNRLNELQDGRGAALHLSIEHALSSSNGVIASASAERSSARDPGYSSKAWRLGVQGWHDIGRSTLFAGAEIGGLRGDERLILFPEARRDRYGRLSIGGAFRSLAVGEMSPFVRVSWERNRSNIAFYDYARTRTEFGVSRAF